MKYSASCQLSVTNRVIPVLLSDRHAHRLPEINLPLYSIFREQQKLESRNGSGAYRARKW